VNGLGAIWAIGCLLTSGMFFRFAITRGGLCGLTTLHVVVATANTPETISLIRDRCPSLSPWVARHDCGHEISA
jgi:hypothetical protein